MFKIEYYNQDSILFLKLNTDLPDYTDIMVSVSRVYWKKGNTSKYSIEYYNEKSKVSTWREYQSVSISSSIWRDKLKNKQNEMSRIGIDLDVERISNDIVISIVVPINQNSSKFGDKNSNLKGTKVHQTGLRIIEDEVTLIYPLNSQSIETKSVSLDPYNLETNVTYILEKETPLMPEFDPVNPIEALNRVIKLPAKSKIKIMNIKVKAGINWYQVNALDPHNNFIGIGWINCTALIGQKLEA